MITHGPRPTEVFLLDAYPAVAAYSLRKLRKEYTGSAIRVIRSSDNSEKDIGFNNKGDLNITQLLDFVGNNDGYIDKFYNQGTGGSTYDGRKEFGDGAKIVSNGNLLKEGGKPTVDFLMGDDAQPPLIVNNEILDIQTVFSVAKVNEFATVNYILGREPSDSIPAQGKFLGGTSNNVEGIGGFDGTNVPTLTNADLLRNLAYINIRGGDFYAAKNGASETNLGSFIAPLRADRIFGRRAGLNTRLRGNVQELIIFDSDENLNKSIIEDNINNYYGIYF